MNRVKIVLLADTHLGFDYPLRPKIARRRRGADFFDNFVRVLDYAVQAKADFVVHGGDLFFRSKIPAKIVDLAYQILLDYAEKGLKIFIVPGNHERAMLPRSLLVNHANLYIFDQPKTFLLETDSTTIALSGFPNVRENIRGLFPAKVAETNWQTYTADIRLLCLHQAIEGAQVGPVNFTFRSGHDTIRMQDIPCQFSAVLAGHIHRQQVLKRICRESGFIIPVIYPGSVERTSFAEKNETKGFFEISFAKNPDKNWQTAQLQFHQLPARPMAEIRIDAAYNQNNFQTRLSDAISGMAPDSIVKLRPGNLVDSGVLKLLTAKYLRSIFPETMNFEVIGIFI